MTFFTMQCISFFNHFFNIPFSQPGNLADLLKLVLEKEKVTQIKFGGIRNYHHYCIEIEHSDRAYPLTIELYD